MILQNAPLSEYNAYKIGGKAKYLAVVRDFDSLYRALDLHQNRLILGLGSKVLISDNGFDGVAVIIKPSAVKICGDTIFAEAGVSLPALSAIAERHSLSGLEWACGIPGSVGGAVMINAGAYGCDMSSVVEYVDVFRGGELRRVYNEDCGFFYRGSGFFSGNPLGSSQKNPQDIVWGAAFKCVFGDRARIAAKRAEYAKKRAAAQPKGFCCGSIFLSGELPAWRYVDECGLRGAKCGGAQISDKHANFILNNGNAKATDVRSLIKAAQAEILIKKGVRLKEEVIYKGNFFEYKSI